MEKKIIKNEFIYLDGQKYRIIFFQIMKQSNQVSYSSEVNFDSYNYDKMIIDDDDLKKLESKVRSVIEIAHRCRMTAKINTDK